MSRDNVTMKLERRCYCFLCGQRYDTVDIKYWKRKTTYDSTLIHSLIYSFVVLLFILTNSNKFQTLDIKIDTAIRIMILIFLTHYPIDRWSLAKIWMEKILKRPFPKFGDLISIERLFNIVVYVVIDNGLHIFLMYTGLKLFFPEYI